MQQIHEKSDSISKSSKSLDLSTSLQQNKNLNIGRKVIDTSEFRSLNSKIKKDSARRSQAKQKKTAVVQPKKAVADTLRIEGPRISVAIPEIPVRTYVYFPEKNMFRKNSDWTFVIIVLALVIIASVRIVFNTFLKQLFNATINYPTATRLFRERTFNLLHAAFRLDVLFYMVISLLAFQVLSFFDVALYPQAPIFTYLICVAGLIGYFIAKRSLYLLISVITESQAETSEYLFNINIYNRVLGIILFPFTLIVAFSPLENVKFLIITGVFFVAVFWGMSLARGAKILLKKHFSISYLILYLCTLEFLPLFVLLKIASG